MITIHAESKTVFVSSPSKIEDVKVPNGWKVQMMESFARQQALKLRAWNIFRYEYKLSDSGYLTNFINRQEMINVLRHMSRDSDLIPLKEAIDSIDWAAGLTNEEQTYLYNLYLNML